MHDQYILFGAPGTGKSHLINERIKNVPEEKIFRVTIHQEYMYTDFVGQLLPQKNGDSVKYEFVPGPFTEALKEAFVENDKEVYLILEEISRGNVAAIFGDIFQLLDRDSHFISEFKIRNKDIANQIKQIHNDIIYLPSNFNIICTVNLNDQNVYPMDTAFKRRFDWEYVDTEPIKNCNGEVDTEINNPKIIVPLKNGEEIETNWLSFYTALNLFILDPENGLGRKEDKQLGQFFVKFNNKDINDSYSLNKTDKEKAMKKINTIIKNKLLMYLWQDIQGSYNFNGKKLFDESIFSFSELYKKFGIEKVFSDEFVDNYLKPNSKKFNY